MDAHEDVGVESQWDMGEERVVPAVIGEGARPSEKQWKKEQWRPSPIHPTAMIPCYTPRLRYYEPRHAGYDLWLKPIARASN